MQIAPSGRWSVLSRIACLAIAAAVLAGCVVVPARPYHPYPRVYHYP